MKTDDELMALAAKAHGNLRYIQRRGWLHIMPNGANGRWWDPRNEDDDALRLMVKLLMHFQCVSFVEMRAGIENQDWNIHASPVESIWLADATDLKDPNAAARLAILRCAAAIGESMP